MSAEAGGQESGRAKLTAWCRSCGREVILTASGACPAGHASSDLTDAPPALDRQPAGGGGGLVAPWTLEAQAAEVDAEAVLERALAQQAAEDRRRNRTLRALLALAISVALMLCFATNLLTTLGDQYFVGDANVYAYRWNLYEAYGDDIGYVRFSSNRYTGEYGNMAQAYLTPRTQVLYHDRRVIDLPALTTRLRSNSYYANTPIALRFGRDSRVGTYGDRYAANELAIDSPRARRAIAWMDTRRYGLVIAGILLFGMVALWFGRCLLARRFRRPPAWLWVPAGIACFALLVFAVPAIQAARTGARIDQTSSVARARAILADTYDYQWMSSDAATTAKSTPTSTGYQVTFNRLTPDSDITLDMRLGVRGELLASTLTSVAIVPTRGSSSLQYLQYLNGTLGTRP